MFRVSRTPIASALLLVVGTCSIVEGAVTVFDSKAEFLAATSAYSATGPLPSVSGQNPSITVGAMTFQGGPGSNGTLQMKDWSARLPGNELAVDGVEEVDIDISMTTPVYALGFDFVEPEFDPFVGAPFVDSTFDVALFDGSAFVASFTFNAPNDVASFVGAWSDLPFDRVEVREIVGANENEFFGEFFISDIPAESPDCGTLNCPKCAQTISESMYLSLGCEDGEFIGEILFASYGTPSLCPEPMVGSCHSDSSQSIVESACLGQQTCTIFGGNLTFGDPCIGTKKRLVIVYRCQEGTVSVRGLNWTKAKNLFR